MREGVNKKKIDFLGDLTSPPPQPNSNDGRPCFAPAQSSFYSGDSVIRQPCYINLLPDLDHQIKIHRTNPIESLFSILHVIYFEKKLILIYFFFSFLECGVYDFFSSYQQ